jgi:hypothetical protein
MSKGVGSGERRPSLAPTAQFFGYFSRKGAKERKGRKGRKRGFCILSALVNYTLRLLTKPFSSLLFPLRPWRPLRLCERKQDKPRRRRRRLLNYGLAGRITGDCWSLREKAQARLAASAGRVANEQ